MRQVLIGLLLAGSLAAQTGYRYDEPSLYWLGSWNAPPGGGPVPHMQSAGTNSALNFEVNCTSTPCNVEIDAYLAQSMKVYLGNIDPAFTPVTSGADAYGYVTVASGLSVGQHLISVTQYGAGMSLATRDQTVRVWNGMLVPVPVYAPQVTMSTAPEVRLDGGPQLASIGGYSNAIGWGFYGGGYRFRASSTALTFWVFPPDSGPSSIQVYQDGMLVRTVTDYGTHDPIWRAVTMATGLSGPHDYEIRPIGGPGSGGGMLLAYGQFPGGGLLPQTAAQAARPIIAGYGDSIIYGSYLSSGSQNAFVVAGNQLGFTPTIFGFPGTTVTGQLSSPSYVNNGQQSSPGTMSVVPNIIVLQGGVNDQRASAPNFQAAMFSQIQNIITGMHITGPTPQILIRGILPTASVNPSTYAAQQRAVVEAFQVSLACTSLGICPKFYDTHTWINPPIDTADGLHPNAQGSAKIANNEVPVFAGFIGQTSYSVTGPHNGTVGTPITLILALPGGATWTGIQTVTVTGDTALTLTPTAGANTYSFNYTPTMAGTKTLSFTSGQDAWTNPGNFSIVVAAAGSGGNITPPVVNIQVNCQFVIHDVDGANPTVTTTGCIATK